MKRRQLRRRASFGGQTMKNLVKSKLMFIKKQIRFLDRTGTLKQPNAAIALRAERDLEDAIKREDYDAFVAAIDQLAKALLKSSDD